MRAFALLFCAIIAVVSGTRIFEEDHSTFADLASIANQINSMQTTWKASVYPKHANATIASLKQRLGTILYTDHDYIAPEVEKTDFPKDAAIPTSFDVRTNWPACSAITSRVRDQSNCGSCWSFSSTESFNDRYCIKTGDAKTVFSPMDTVSCCSGRECAFSMGCNGGQPSGAWDWFTKTGVSSGADWADVGAGTTCKPYAMQSCAHHCTVPGLVDCTNVESYSTPKCTSTCSESGYGTGYSNDKHKATSSYAIRGVSNIQQELMEKGSISVAFTVYEDFETYTSGIYQHKTGKSLGGHAVKLVGWGEENGTPYWTIMNSWNSGWGEKGSFRIIRGTNECGIESQAVAGEA